MNSRFAFSALRWVPVTLLLVAAGCGSDTDDGEGSNRCGYADPECLGCAPLGGCCLATVNCPVATICNLPGEPLFNPRAEEGACLKVTCESNADCDAPEICTLEKLCRTPVCQVDANCTGGDVCIAGSCTARPDPNTVSACTLTTRGATLREGARLPLSATAQAAGGAPLPGIAFTFESSAPGVVSVDGTSALGGAEAGEAVITARAGSVACEGQAAIRNQAAGAVTEVRVAVVSDVTGAPVVGATVRLEGAAPATATTDGSGLARFEAQTGLPGSVSVTAPGFQIVTIVEPGTREIFLPLPREPVTDQAGGFRGILDISRTNRGDIQLGFAGPALPSNLLDFGLDALVGDLIPTEIDAPELGLELTGMDAVSLPGGLVLSLGNRRFTADGAGSRCQGATPGAGQLGCYVANAPEGLTAAWALGGQLRLSAVTGIASTLSDAFGDGGEDLPIGDILVSVLPLLRSLNHAIAASLDVSWAPKVNGASDFTRFQRVDLEASQPLGVLSVVNVPNLPGPTGACAGAAVLLAGANLPGRGLVPLGITAGLDALTPDGPRDCRISGVPEAFGSGSANTQDGQMALSMAPLHSGAEGSELFLLLVAADIDQLLSDDGFQATALVQRAPSGVSAEQRIDGSFLPLPTGTLRSGERRIEVAPVEGATLNRYEVQGGGRTWLIYAPSTATSIDLPQVDGSDAVLADPTAAYLLGMGMEGRFSEVFEVGSGRTLDRLLDTITSFSVQQCARTEGASCLIQ